MASEHDGWRSVRGGKACWKQEEVTILADAFYEALPESAKTLLARSSWKGGPLISLVDKATWTVRERDLQNNMLWIREVARRYRDRVPSAFFLADCILQLDGRFDNKLLLVTQKDETRQSLALADAGRLKKCLQYLRCLFRDAPEGARIPQIAELKTFLRKRPRDEDEAGVQVDSESPGEEPCAATAASSSSDCGVEHDKITFGANITKNIIQQR